MKKMLSLVLALAMVLSLTTMAWAAGPEIIDVDTNAELVEALKTNADEVVINLSAAPTDGTEKFTIDLYSGTPVPYIKSLTINGTNYTKVKFYKNVAVKFDELTINNCEILKNTDKGWGHLLFSKGKENGIYTVSNCVFNSAGDQGIYFNPSAGNEVYVVKGCTFNGNFGVEGALSYQNNNISTTLSVSDNTFNLTNGEKIAIHYHKSNLNLSSDVEDTVLIKAGNDGTVAENFQRSIDSSEAGDTFKLIESVDLTTLSTPVVISKPITINANGKTLVGLPVGSNITTNANGEITGGTFAEDVSGYLADGYIQKANGEVYNPNAGTTGGTQVTPLGAATKPVKGNGLENNMFYTYSKDSGLREVTTDTVPFGTTLYALLTDEDGYPVKYDAVNGLNVSDKWTENGSYVKDVKIVKVGGHYAIAISTTGSSLEEVQVLGNLAVKGKSLYKDAQGKAQKADVKFDVDVEIGLAWPVEDNPTSVETVTEKKIYDFEGIDDEDFLLTFGPFDVETDTKGMKKVLMSYNDDEVEAITDKYPEADLEFVNCEANFRRTATVTVELLEGYCLYEIVDGKLVEVNGEYDDWTEEFIFKTRRLGSYVISDTELEVGEAVVVNPSTGTAA